MMQKTLSSWVPEKFEWLENIQDTFDSLETLSLADKAEQIGGMEETKILGLLSHMFKESGDWISYEKMKPQMWTTYAALVQAAMIKQGITIPQKDGTEKLIICDGKYGRNTMKAVKIFMDQNNISYASTDKGFAGPKVLEQLERNQTPFVGPVYEEVILDARKEVEALKEWIVSGVSQKLIREKKEAEARSNPSYRKWYLDIKTNVGYNPDKIYTRREYIEMVRPLAEEISAWYKEKGFNLPAEIIIKQSVVESQWKRLLEDGTTDRRIPSVAVIDSSNFYGITSTPGWEKRGWGIQKSFDDDKNWKRIKQNFRKYTSLEESFLDYAHMMTSWRHKEIFMGEKSVDEIITEIWTSWYAENPHYADLLRNIKV